MSSPVYVLGVGMTPFGVHESATVGQLARWAAADAVTDAGIDRDQVGAIYFGNTTQAHLEGQLMINGQVALLEAGFDGVPIVNVENACATGSSALSLAVTAVRAGETPIALAVGAEKMHVGDPERSMQVFAGGYDVSDPQGLTDVLDALGGATDDSSVGSRSVFMDIYAAMARSHMRAFGTTRRQIAAVAAKNHAHAVDNERAYYRKPMTIDDVLAGRALMDPLTVPMCSPLTDGAAAVVVCDGETVERLAATRAVEVLACVVGTGVSRDLDDYSRHVTRLVAQRAYERAGVGPEDVSVAEVHDASAFAEILISEMLGLVEWGGGGPAAEAGVTSIGGRIPINPSGGLESKGHPLGATGLGQVFELVGQLRGEAGTRQVDDARVAVAENGGGFLRGEEAAAVVTVLKGR